jgi:hypothetical protein
MALNDRVRAAVKSFIPARMGYLRRNGQGQIIRGLEFSHEIIVDDGKTANTRR